MGRCECCSGDDNYFCDRFTKDEYAIRATVAIEQQDNPLSSAENALSFNFGLAGSGLLETRQAILQSYAHNLRVAQNLGWEVEYFTEGRLNRRESTERTCMRCRSTVNILN